MKKLLAAVAAAAFVLAGPAVAQGTAPAAKGAATAAAKLEKPADVSADAWAKMTDAEKKAAVDKSKGAAKSADKAAAKAPAKEKKGGC